MGTKINIWLQAFRLRTLPLALSSTLVGSFLAYSFSGFRIGVFIFAILTTLFLQILSNLANDYGDAVKGSDNPDRIGPERVTQSGKVSHQAIRRMIVFFVVLSLLAGSVLIFVGLNQFPVKTILVFFAIGFSAIYASVKYTVGRNPYGYVGLGDLFVYLYFGLIGVCGTFFLHTGFFDPWILLPASSIGLFSSGVLNLNNLRDVDNDAENGKRTLVVRIGVKAAKVYHLVIVVVGIVLTVIYTLIFFKSPVQLLFMATIPFLYYDIRTVMLNTVPVDLNGELKKLALTTFAFSVTFSAGLILQ
ncbi:MAG: 1,4-dihydroxy-2-naphthoate polyprenyltransferase [Bacteroidales bacterium]|nr:1,4-dihydroxy-2-naphthoate polyprenyltransferase [Bacteroidales bacterium]MBN2819801.1 1,4-dihydroxy-2-naphthoate polyprenyltransferase [Bacteroidales bacterium]